jgi:hypothetical protein
LVHSAKLLILLSRRLNCSILLTLWKDHQPTPKIWIRTGRAMGPMSSDDR